MIHHISIAAKDPKKVANVIATIWQARALPFPPFPGAYIVALNDGHGTAIEVTPLGTELLPGTDDQEVQPRVNEAASPYTATHAALSVPISEAQVIEIAKREGWKVGIFERGGAFQVMEFWVENRLLLELLPPAMAKRYLDFATPQNFADLFQLEFVQTEEQLAA